MAGQSIYIVTEGTHSAYRIVGVFSDKTVAEDHCAAHNGTDRSYSGGNRRVEEWPVDDTVPPEHGVLLFLVKASLDGWTLVEEAAPSDALELSLTSIDGRHWRQAVWAGSESDAQKIVLDNIAMKLAEGAGIG